ncbi:MAG: hypothetical protein AB7F75_01735 [Planctomycetota bacterium]
MMFKRCPRVLLTVWMAVGCCAVAQPIGRKPGPAAPSTHVEANGETTTSEPPPELAPPRR